MNEEKSSLFSDDKCLGTAVTVRAEAIFIVILKNVEHEHFKSVQRLDFRSIVWNKCGDITT